MIKRYTGIPTYSFLIAIIACLLISFPSVAQEPVPDTLKEEKKQFRYLFSKDKTDTDSIRDSQKTDSALLIDFYNMSLEQLDSLKASGLSDERGEFLNSYLTVSMQKSLSTRDNPAIVSLVTREEIQNSGARDLLEILDLVPGFHFAQDEDGIVSIGVRGNWANEGKVLLMIDGVEMNENFLSRLSLGNHYPARFVERVEVLRGPGSVIYGGYAEFAVINVITMSAADHSGIAGAANISTYSDGAGRKNLHLYAANKWNDLSIKFMAEGGKGHRSDLDHYGFYDKYYFNDSTLGVGDYATLANNSDINSLLTNTSISYKGLRFVHISDMYEVRDISTIDSSLKHPVLNALWSNNFDLQYNYQAFGKLSVIPRINFNVLSPSEKVSINDPGNEERKNRSGKFYRIHPSMIIDYDINHRLHFLGGGDLYVDIARGGDPDSWYYIDTSDYNMVNASVFGQIFYKTILGNLVLGGRYEISSQYKPSLVPRIGLTKSFERFHYKLLFSGAYKSPTIGNYLRSYNGTIELNTDSTQILSIGHGIKPEQTYVLEAEIGFRLNKNIQITANFFDITIFDPIVYTYHQDARIRNLFGPAAGILAYQNFDKAGTMGTELELRMKNDWGYLNLNYSFYSTRLKPGISAYSVSTFNRDPSLRSEIRSDMLLAFPKHKLTLNACVYMTDNFSFNLTASYQGIRYGYDVLLGGDVLDDEGNIIIPAKYNVDGQLEEKKPVVLTSMNLRYQNLFTEGLSASLGLRGFFNNKYEYMQPYFGLRTPLPVPTREVNVSVSYRLPFGKNK